MGNYETEAMDHLKLNSLTDCLQADGRLPAACNLGRFEVPVFHDETGL